MAPPNKSEISSSLGKSPLLPLAKCGYGGALARLRPMHAVHYLRMDNTKMLSVQIT